MAKQKKSLTKVELEERLTDLEESYKRALADYQNLTKQHQKERQDYLKYSNSELITQLLPLLDNLQMAYQHLEDPGVEMIIKQFQQVIAEEGIEEINPSEGDTFDSQFHEGIDTVEGTEDNEDQIAETSLVGYKYTGGQVLRHTKVKVYKKAEN